MKLPRRRRCIAWAVAGLLVLALIGWVLLGRFQAATAADPAVEGRPLRAWLVDLNSGEPGTREAARAVLDRIPPEARAHRLLRFLEASGGRLDRAYERHREQLPRRVHYWLIRNFRPHEWTLARRTAAAELRGCAAALAPDTLGRLLRDPDRAVAAHASHALTAMGARAVPVLREAVRTEDPQVREFACNSLATLGPAAVAALPELLAVLEANDPSLNRIVIPALSRMGAEAVPMLGEWLETANVWRRRQAIEVLEGMQPLPPSAAPGVRRAAQDDDLQVRQTATRLVGRVRPFSAQDEQLLRDRLQDDHPGLRAAAAAAAGATGHRALRLVPDLEQRLGDEDPQVRTLAQQSLRRLNASVPRP